jgi:hypothetical protein
MRAVQFRGELPHFFVAAIFAVKNPRKIACIFPSWLRAIIGDRNVKQFFHVAKVVD